DFGRTHRGGRSPGPLPAAARQRRGNRRLSLPLRRRSRRTEIPRDPPRGRGGALRRRRRDQLEVGPEGEAVRARSSIATRRRALLTAVSIAAAVVARGQPAALGRTDFPTSGSPAAQEPFLRGALLLHSFEYSDAAEAFRKAQAAQPGFAMAYWGEAMTYNHPLWSEQDRDAARRALERLAPTPAERLAKAPTPREKMYLEAVEALYGEGDRAARDRAYAEAMRRLHERFPDDLDAEAFYALALLGTTEGKRDFAVYMKAAALVEDVFAKNREHPGAAHYLIHCYDDPVHAPLGMRAARVYAGFAPAAVHALHMP